MFHYADVVAYIQYSTHYSVRIVIRQAYNKQILGPEKTVEQTKVLNVH